MIPRAGDTVNISTGTVSVPSTAQFRTLNFSAGTLTGSPQVVGTLNWTGGQIAANVTVPESGLVNVLGLEDKFLAGGWLNNSGRLIWSSASQIRVSGGIGITNQASGLFEFQSSGTLRYDSGAVPTFINNGSLRKTAGAGVAAIVGIPVVNNGTVIVSSGTLLLTSHFTNSGETRVGGGTLELGGGGQIGGNWSVVAGTTVALTSGVFQFDANAIFNGPGNFGVTGDATLSGTVSKRNFLIAGTARGTFTLTGSINWTSGEIHSNLTISSGAMLNLLGTAQKVFGGGSLANSGRVVWLGGTLRANDGFTLNNLPAGTFDIQCDAFLQHGTGATPQFLNGGIFRKSITTGATTMSGIPFTNNGTVEALRGTLAFGASFINTGQTRVESGALHLQGGGQIAGAWSVSSGASVELQEGAFHFNEAAVFNGPGAFGVTGNVVLSGTFSRRELHLTGSVSGSFTITGSLTWSAGQIGAALTIAPGALLNVVGSAQKTFNGGVVNNAGTINWSAGDVRVMGGTVFTNSSTGVFEIQSDVSLHHESGDRPRFVNLGTFRKSAGTGTAHINGLSFQNIGTVLLNSGTLHFGSEFLNDGLAQVESGTLTLSGGGTISSRWTLAGGTSIFFTAGSFEVSPNALFFGSGVYGVNGDVTLSGILAAANFRVMGTVGGIFQLTGSVVGAFTNVGTINWSRGQISADVTVAPAGTFNLVGNQEKTFSAGVFKNLGKLVWSDTGRIRVSGGTVFTNLPGGLFDFQSNSTLFNDLSGQPRIMNLGEVRKSAGSGTTSLNAIPFTNAGTIEVHTGVLRIDRSDLSELGTTRVFAASPTTYGRLSLPGQVTLRGELELVFAEPFNFWPSVTLLPVFYGPRTGTFSAVNGANIPLGTQLVPDYRASNLLVTINPPAPVLTPAKPSFAVGEPITFSFRNAPGNPKDRIAIYPQGIVPGSSDPASSLYLDGTETGTNGLTEGTITLPGLSQVGTWSAYLLWNERTNTVAQATFQTIPLFAIALNASPVSGGSVSGAGTFPLGSERTVTARPFDNYLFQNWTENGAVVSTSSQLDFVVDGARNLVANFTLAPVDVMITTSPAGRSLTVDGQTFDAPRTFSWTPGSRHTVSAPTPQAGADETRRFAFERWSDDLEQTHEIIAPADTTTFTAHFISQFRLEAHENPPNSGVVTQVPNRSWHDAGARVLLTADPDPGYNFSGWTGVDSSEGSAAEVVMTSPKTVIASFDLSEILVSIERTAQSGRVIRFSAVPEHTYRIEASTDLATWTSLSTFADRSGMVSFTDPNAPPNRRFYRVARD